MEVVVLDYGAGNVRSVVFALERLGISARLSNDPQVISNADYIIFPGQGAAAMAMNKLNLYGLTAVLPNLKQPILGICLGMQLLFENTEEGNTRGLGILKGSVKKFESGKIPQMGWNSLQNLRGSLFDSINENTHMYLVHSYYAPVVPETLATTTYGTTYSVAVQKDNFYGVQFHPEKSSQAGQQLLQNFLQIKQ
ncbi:MAG: imidazole glycerol phosphate synthase subunit HisH [Flavobacteriaceae bacterium TMED120]|nr:MAG: imidazole glycerol phosphate synthase subunit HisH [Flavobacteriaceae bacterium TMED120]HCQ24526.1 imidazole glycerol phosphate synthase subunit HisH [Flavobacteriaceae bacterium]|tara:strand:+ start:237 stop:821 length:585 start_codon:yes stop_codon:yes gene_type:complete